MTEEATSPELPFGRSFVGRELVGAVYRRFTDPRAMVSTTRLGALVLTLLVAYFVFVVPAQLATLLVSTLVFVAVVALAPFAVVTTTVWVLE